MPPDYKQGSKSKDVATAGPSPDDRFGAGPLATNLSSRIIKVDVVGDRTRITVTRGKTHGIHAGMEGYIKSSAGMLADFQIDEVKDRACLAFVDVTPDQLTDHLQVVINPSARPTGMIKSDTSTRVLAVSVEDGRTKITIARGTVHGVVAGIRGQLVSEDGREGEAFTIYGTTANQSFAYINATVDHVNQHKQVTLRAPGRATVQRRAAGVARSVDVESTAQGGVAGASSRIPHFDAIQRSFGKHDISNIQANVGGPAASASKALGAEAYATGDKVAFASSPDLHTAAHEAAHTIQQRHGAVRFQGLGAADDEHERHADAVADAVVAGKSAEPLLDQLVGGQQSTAIQRRSRDPIADEPLEANTITLGFRGAQQVLDSLSESAADPSAIALHHLRHVAAAANKRESDIKESEVRVAADSFDQALNRFLERRLQPSKTIDELIHTNRQIRNSLAFPRDSTRAAYKREGGTETEHAKTTLPSVLRLIASRAQGGATRLDENVHKNRDQIVERIATELETSIVYADFLIQRIDRRDRDAFAADLELAACEVHYVLRWIRSHTAHRVSEQRFLKTVHAFDHVLLAGGASTIEGRQAPTLTERALHTSTIEARAMQDASTQLTQSLEKWKEAQLSAIGLFRDLAQLKDREEPDFVAEVLKALFIAALGHFAGYVIGQASTKGLDAINKARRVATQLSKGNLAVIQRVIDTTTDATQSVAGKLLEPKTDEQDRTRAFFVANMRMHVVERVTALESSVSTMQMNSEITTQQIYGLRDFFELTAKDVGNAFLTHLMKAWANYVAQSRLAGRNRKAAPQGPQGWPSSEMDSYFGDRLPNGHRVVGTSRAHGAGVLSITMHVRNGLPKIEREHTKIIGMNSEILGKILEDADYKLANVFLPKEVNVRGNYGRAVIALDEHNVARDETGWSEVVRETSLLSGAEFWSRWGKGVSLK